MVKQIQIDTREKKKELVRIEKQFDQCGVKYFKSKLYVGDYVSLDNPRLVIDRKKDLLEICTNVCQQHERFRAELVRAMEQDIKIIILCEDSSVESIEDVYFWDNPRLHEYDWIMEDGHPKKILKNPKAVTGQQLYKSLCTIRDKYNVDFVFCKPSETGKRIIELLEDHDG